MPFCTAALEVHDPVRNSCERVLQISRLLSQTDQELAPQFALARLKAIEAAEAAGEPITEVMDLSRGGLEVWVLANSLIMRPFS